MPKFKQHQVTENYFVKYIRAFWVNPSNPIIFLKKAIQTLFFFQEAFLIHPKYSCRSKTKHYLKNFSKVSVKILTVKFHIKQHCCQEMLSFHQIDKFWVKSVHSWGMTENVELLICHWKLKTVTAVFLSSDEMDKYHYNIDFT